MTTVVTYRVLLRESEDATEYTVERTYRSLVRPSPEAGPYLSQEGDVFFVDASPRIGEPVDGWRSAPMPRRPREA